MDQRTLEQALAGLPLAKIAFFARVGSTNDVAAGWATAGEPGICLAVADEQTKGRGRAGRGWHTPPGAALAFSLLLPDLPGVDREKLGLVSGLGALAVCEGLEELFGAPTEIKWPNDVLVGGKKVCGVLAEAQWSGDELQALVLGIGINIASSSMPPAEMLNFPASSLEEALARQVERKAVLAKALERLFAWRERLGTPEFVAAWEQRLAYRGKLVQLEGAGEGPVEGRVQGLGPDGSLRLELADGAVNAFRVGEIGLRPAHHGASK